MNVALQNQINPPTAKNNKTDLTPAKIKEATKVVDSNDTAKTSFKDLLLNSNSEIIRKRSAMKNGSDLSAAKTDQEFFKMLSEQSQGKINPEGPKKELDKDAFMKLFITQLQNQDPLNPDDSAKMAAQLAQFQGLEQMTNVNKNLEKMSTEQSVNRAVDLVGFVGKEIKLSGGRLRLENGKLTDAHFQAPTPIANAYLEVRDGAGVVVSKNALGSIDKGEHALSWDGKGKNGEKLRDGIYTFAVVANDAEGQEVPVDIISSVKVTGIDMQEAGGSFFTDLGKVGMHEVDSVGDQGYTQKARAAEESIEQAKAAKKAAETAALEAAEKLNLKANAPELAEGAEAAAEEPQVSAAPATDSVAPQPATPPAPDMAAASNPESEEAPPSA